MSARRVTRRNRAAINSVKATSIAFVSAIGMDPMQPRCASAAGSAAPPPRLDCLQRDLTPPLRRERAGAGRAAFQAAEPAECNRVRVFRRDLLADDGDPLGGRATAGARRANVFCAVRLERLTLELAHETSAAYETHREALIRHIESIDT